MHVATIPRTPGIRHRSHEIAHAAHGRTPNDQESCPRYRACSRHERPHRKGQKPSPRRGSFFCCRECEIGLDDPLIWTVGASTDRGSAHNAPRICGDFLRVLGALTSPPASDGTRLTCVLELSAGDRCAPLVRPCAGRLGQDAPAAERHPSIERYSKSCRAWEPGPVKRSETTND
jgi:hypothetical protein